jgi:ADP-heptose:LPS heptosyltransferase
MTRILVVQLTRMGDVIQTSPLTRVLKQKHPDAHVTMMVRGMGKTVAERNPHIDEVIVYDEAVMFADVCSSDSDRLLKAYHAAEGLAARIRDGAYDLVINCTHSIASAMLIALSGVKNVVGAHLSDDWQFVLRGPWANYFFTSVFDRHFNSLNLCDIVRNFGEASAQPSELSFDVGANDREEARVILEQAGITPLDTVVVMQLGASQDNKRWPVSHFVSVAQSLAKQRDARIVLVGVKDEKRFGDEFERIAPGTATHLFGKTTIPQLAAILERSSLLVTNDTGTMHVAAAVRCPIVLVSVGFVHFRETGPYGNGHIAIEQRRDQVGAAAVDPGAQELETPLTPEVVLRVIDAAFTPKSDRSIRFDAAVPFWQNVDVYMSRFAADGCLEWYPLVQRRLDERAVLLIAYRAMWLHILRGQHDVIAESESISQSLGCYDTAVTGLETLQATLTAHFEGLSRLAERGIAMTVKLLDVLARRDFSAAQAGVNALLRLDDEIRVYGEVHPACKSLVLIARYERENLEGFDAAALAQKTLAIYETLRERAALTISKVVRVIALSA